MLDWVDGRNASSFSAFSWNGSSLGFTIVWERRQPVCRDAAAADGEQDADFLTRNGSTVFFSAETVKGIAYAAFPAAAGAYVATYA